MINVYSKALEETIEVERVIGELHGSEQGPTVVFIGGIHGNEPSGVFALHKVMNKLNEDAVPIVGSIYAISGNLWALEKGVRYHKEDLNRIWTKKRFELLEEEKLPINTEDARQQQEIYDTIVGIINKEEGPFYFIDLHTTSSDTIPFLTVNDSLMNRKYTQQFPVPIILGIEEYLDGPLLSAINALGYVAFGFEGGQHDDLAAIENHMIFILLNLVCSGVVQKTAIDFQHYYEQLAKSSINLREIFEIYDRYEIEDNALFKMKPGYVNFQWIKKGEKLADYAGKEIISKENSRILMPLYQNQGNDGYFLIRRIPRFILNVSAALRKIKFDNLLPLLPGVKWASKKKDVMLVNLRISRFFAKSFFHLLGYRNKTIDKNHLIIRNREKASRKKEYKKADWY